MRSWTGSSPGPGILRHCSRCTGDAGGSLLCDLCLFSYTAYPTPVTQIAIGNYTGSSSSTTLIQENLICRHNTVDMSEGPRFNYLTFFTVAGLKNVGSVVMLRAVIPTLLKVKKARKMYLRTCVYSMCRCEARKLHSCKYVVGRFLAFL